MNIVCLIGRNTKDLDLRYTQQGKAVANGTIAVTRQFNREQTDFINYICFGKTAENVANYSHKGDMLAIEGSLQVDTYDKDGQKRTTYKVVANRIKFLSKKQRDDSSSGFAEDDLPF